MKLKKKIKFDTIKRIRTKRNKINKKHSILIFGKGNKSFEAEEREKRRKKIVEAISCMRRLHTLHHCENNNEMH
jgi:hypothetical protein